MTPKELAEERALWMILLYIAYTRELRGKEQKEQAASDAFAGFALRRLEARGVDGGILETNVPSSVEIAVFKAARNRDPSLFDKAVEELAQHLMKKEET